MTVDEMVETIGRKWSLSSPTSLSSDIIKLYLKDAVLQVENVDYSTNTDYTIDANGDVTFDTEPADGVSMLYIFCALAELQKAYIKDLLDDGSIGVTVRSGMESVSSSAASGLHSKMTQDFEKQYLNILNRYKINDASNSAIIKVYPVADYTSTI